ncbi:MAG: LUD domain-containing protein [Siphonobacter sp.]
MSREKILGAIRQNKPDLLPLPAQFKFESNYPDRLTQFQQVLQAIGGTSELVPSLEVVSERINALFPGIQNVAVTIPELSHLADFNLTISDPHELASIQLAILPGRFGVAENGAIWFTEKEMQHRVLPFITQYLAIVIKANSIVENMHRAYEQIHIDETGFGTFVAGPSKTADIEQSLVVGAHGPRSLIVFIIE